ncbi:MAG TPA: class I SAM-dependent methyltransferase [Terriglobales bacterium]|nr:class I SAM-dependent methyltransferase [Terriglobales bacterium]
MNASSTLLEVSGGTPSKADVCSSLSSAESVEEVDRVAKQRLYPSITDSSWLVLRARRQLFLQWLTKIPGKKISVLDVGGRIQPYRPLLNGREEKYVAVDTRRSPRVSVLAAAEEIPLESEQFDLVICTQVLQYVADPARAIAEMFRLLKPGGHLLMSVPAAYPRDSEHECWRFLPHGLKTLTGSFSSAEIAAEGGSISGLCRTVAVWLTMFARPTFLRTVLCYSVVPLLNLSAVALEPLFGKNNDQFAVNYSLFAQK